MARDHQLLVSRDGPGGDPAFGRADPGGAGIVRRIIELQTEPCRRAADRTADRRAVLADAGREDDRVEAAERGGERADLPADPVDEEIDGQANARVRARFERAHGPPDSPGAAQAR